MKNTLLLLCVFTIFFLSCKSTTGLKYYTGLQVFKDFDSSRTFDTTSPKSPMYYTPVKIDLFYPSGEKPAKAPLIFGDIMDMYEQRMNYFNSMDSCRKVSAQLAAMFADYLHVDSASKLLNIKTEIYNGLKFPSQKLPLIIYASSMNGSSWENLFLYDSLVHHGYVVAVISSVGKFPGYMSGAEDLEEQVDDILYAIKKMKTFDFVDSDKIGLLSWSLGGTAIVKTAMLSKDVKCLLSYDGTEIHYFGFDTAWDTQYKEIMKIPPYTPGSITVPYMYLSSEHPKRIDSVYVFSNFISSKEKYFLKFTNAIHENFSALPVLAKTVDPKLNNIDSGRSDIITKLTVTFFDQYLKQIDTTSTKKVIDELVATKSNFVSTEYLRK
ncbi:MAG: hypothetical protein JO072_11635 [Parafilimonas sp.]|nr:hypothetical protein [Parafilimonas sp.]